jgi:hypothetical protein
VTIRAAVRGSTSVFPISVHARRRVGQWLVASVTCTAVGCTLTDGGFEPTLVDGIETSESTGAPAPLPLQGGSQVGQESSPPTASSDDREGATDVRIAPAKVSVVDAGGSSEVSGTTDTGVPGTSVGRADAGAVVDDGTEVPVPPAAEPCTSRVLAGSCYELFDELVSWDVAEQRCVGWGGHLASIESADENQGLNTWPVELGITSVDGSGIWLGGTDAERDGEFLWVVGSPFAFPGWAATQPDNGAGIDCIEKRNDGAGGWYDRHCTDALRYLCERPL